MKIFRYLTLALVICLPSGLLAQKAMNADASQAQRSVFKHLEANGVNPKIDDRDNSVNFKVNNVFYWVTFDEENPVLYTIHRKGINFNDDPAFKASLAALACDEVNKNHPVKCILNDKRVDFIMQTYANDPAAFNASLKKMLAGFNNVDIDFKTAYNKNFDQWKQDSIEARKPIIPNTPIGKSPLVVSGISFANVDAGNNFISEYNQPLRKSAMKFLSTMVMVESPEKGIYKLGLKIVNPEGKEMLATKGVEYSETSNLEIKKPNKPQELFFAPFGSTEDDFWKAGEYKVEIFDFEKGVKLYATTFHIL